MATLPELLTRDSGVVAARAVTPGDEGTEAGGGVDDNEADGGDANDAGFDGGEHVMEVGCDAATPMQDESDFPWTRSLTTTVGTWLFFCFGGVGLRTGREGQLAGSGSRPLDSETPNGALVPHGFAKGCDRTLNGRRIHASEACRIAGPAATGCFEAACC